MSHLLTIYFLVAISTLLQAPIIQTGLSTISTQSNSSGRGAFRAPTSRDIPPVSLKDAPRVDNALFSTYLTQATPLFNALQRAQATDSEPRSSGDDMLSPVSATFSHSDRQSPQRRHQSGRTGVKIAPPVTSLSTIPSIYFELDFHLENPRTFDIVSEKSELISKPTPKGGDAIEPGDFPVERKFLTTNAILQEKMSWYIDTVESHLTTSISVASTSFFAALDSLRTLQKEAEESVALLKKLRTQLAELDREMAMNGLEILALKQKRKNLSKLGDSLDQLSSIMGGFVHCRGLIESQDYDQALEKIDILESYVHGKSPAPERGDPTWLTADPTRPIYDLHGLVALAKVPAEVSQMRAAIGKAFESRFINAMLDDLKRHAASIPISQTLEQWSYDFQRSRGGPSGRASRPQSRIPTYMVTAEAFSREVSTCLQTLNRTGQSSQAAIAFRDAVMREMKGVIRTHLPSSSDDDTVSVVSSSTRASTRSGTAATRQEKSMALARNLAALDAASAEELVYQTYTSVGEVLRRLGTQIKVILDVTTNILPLPPARHGTNSQAGSPDTERALPSKSRQRSNSATLRDELASVLDITAILGQAVDVGTYYITRVLRARSDATIHLPLDHFIRYIAINRLFLNECEAISGRPDSSITSVVDGQIRSFVSAWAEERRLDLQQALDSDRWSGIEVGPADRVILERIERCSQADVPEWIIKAIPAEGSVADSNPADAAQESGESRSKHIFIGDSKFILVESSLNALRSLEQYCILITNVPSLVNEISVHLLDYLKLFNSRSCQLILGAGATRSAGLVNINTRHLALAYLSLSFLMKLVDFIRDFAVRRMSASTTFPQEVEKARVLLCDHQLSIEEKLIDIMSSRSSLHISAMLGIQFDSADVVSQETSVYMDTLTKETATLHRVLSRHLDGPTVVRIMDEVFSRYRDHWGRGFEVAVDRVRTRDGWERLKRDADLFEWKIGRIEGAGDLGALVVQIVDSGRVGGPEEGQSEAAAEQDPADGSGAEVSGDVKPDEQTELEPQPELPPESAPEHPTPATVEVDPSPDDTVSDAEAASTPVEGTGSSKKDEQPKPDSE